MSNAYFNSTALLYRDRYLITAAHNVHTDAFSRVRTIDVTCGTADATRDRPNDQAHPEDVRVLDGYTFARSIPERYERDVAVVRLNRPICVSPRARIGSFRPVASEPLTLAGYPGRRGDPDQMNGKRLYSAGGTVRLAAEPYLFRHNVVTEKGNSGGPVWVERDVRPLVVGVHVGEGGAARLFTQSVVEEIERLIDQFEAAQPAPRGEQCARP